METRDQVETNVQTNVFLVFLLKGGSKWLVSVWKENKWIKYITGWCLLWILRKIPRNYVDTMTNRSVSVQQQWWGNSADGSGIISGYSELYSLYRVRSQHLLNTLVTPPPVPPRTRARYSYVIHKYKCFIVMSRLRCGGEAEAGK